MSESLEDNVNVVSICETVTHETAEALGRMSTKELELQAALQRLAITAQGTINDLTLNGDTQQTAFVVAFLTKRLPDLGDEILKAAKGGYLNGSISDFVYMIDKNMAQITESRARLTERNRKHAAAERAAAERKTNKLPKASSKISDPLVLQCQNCNQLLNVPKGTNWKVSCPTCGNSWIHDGTKSTDVDDDGETTEPLGKHYDERLAKLERREKRLSAEKELEENSRKEEEERKAEQRKKDREFSKKRWEEAVKGTGATAAPRVTRTVSTHNCVNCTQPLYVRDGYVLNICCPTCWHSWQHDGTGENMNTEMIEVPNPPLDALPNFTTEPKLSMENVPLEYARCPSCNQAQSTDLKEVLITCPTCEFSWDRGAIGKNN